MEPVGLLITGNEVLSYKTRDTNGPVMGMHFRKYGIPICASMTCADSKTDLLSCLTYLSNKSDTLLMTGGLGPTSDDLTAQIISEFLNIPLEFNEQAWQSCVEHYTRIRKGNIPESNRKQAFLPKNCEILPNKYGTAVGFYSQGVVLGKQVTIYCMPGVPYEMEPMFLEYVLPKLVHNIILPVSKTWQVFYLGESAMQTAIEETEKELMAHFPNASISYQAHPYYVSYSATLFPASESQRNICTEYLESDFGSQVRKAFTHNIIYGEDQKLSEFIMSKLKHNKISISFCETSNAGYLSKEFSAFSQDSNYFLGSIVASSHEVKKNVLKFSQAELELVSSCELANLLTLRTFNVINSDIVLAECSTPAFGESKQKHIDQKDSHYSLCIGFKSELFNFEKLNTSLKNFSWEKSSRNLNSKDFMIYECQIPKSRFHQSDIQKLRATYFMLCSLASVLENVF